jgi:SnoaL-like domain
MKTPTVFLLVMSLLIPLPALSAADESLEKRIQVLEDKEAIRALLLNYGRFLDARDWEAYAGLFAADGGTWNGGMGIAKGHDEILQMMTSTIGANGSGLSNLHLLGNEFIDVNGDTATALSKWVFVMTAAEGGPDVVYVGHYEDELVRENGAWKFILRTVSGDITRQVTLPGLDNDSE